MATLLKGKEVVEALNAKMIEDVTALKDLRTKLNHFFIRKFRSLTFLLWKFNFSQN